MKKIVCFLALSALKVSAQDLPEKRNAARLMVGAHREQIVLNADFKRDYGANFSLGGYLFFAPEEKASNQPRINALGFDLQLRQSLDEFDLYFRPGLGLGVYETRTKNYAGIAPVLGIGFNYYLHPQLAVGFENLRIFNWSEDNLFSAHDSFLLSVQLRL